MSETSVEINDTGYTLTWSNISYSVKEAGATKQILSNLYGFAKPGTVTAIIGASGSGKTSLLEILSGRVLSSCYTGDVGINGKTSIPIKNVSHYCPQQEALFSTLTVEQTLNYAAHFNLHKSTPPDEKKAIVDRIIKEFGLERSRGTIIGGPLRKGCSGGEIRRVSVAEQVIGIKNEIIFLDEPTSNLDGVAAESVIHSVQNLAKHFNCAVISTIHQPSTETFQLFSHVLILAAGSTVFFGLREIALEHFESIGHPVGLRVNPSDQYLQLTNIDFAENEAAGKERVFLLQKGFRNSPHFTRVLEDIREAYKNSENFEIPGNIEKHESNGFVYQTKILSSRAFLNAAKNPLSYWIRVSMYVALAILMGTTWFRMNNEQDTVSDRMAGLFFTVAFLSFMSVAGIPAFLEERLVFMRETANGLYSVESYMLSNFFVSIPFIFIITLSFSCTAYFLMGLQESVEKFATFVAILFVSLMIAEAQTVFISVAIPIFVAALAITAFTNGLWMVVQGFFVQKKNIPDFWKYSFHQIDFQKYSYELLISNELKGLTFECGPSWDFSENCDCLFPTPDKDNCTFIGEDVLVYFDIFVDASFENNTSWFGILIGIFLFFKLATYVLLKIRTRNYN